MPCDGDSRRPIDACESLCFLRRPGGGRGIVTWDAAGESCDADDEMYPPNCDRNGLPTNGRSGGCDCDCEDCEADSDAKAGCDGSEGSAVERSSGRRPGDARALVALLVALERFAEIGVS